MILPLTAKVTNLCSRNWKNMAIKMSQNLLQEIKRKMNERRDETLITLLLYLQTGNFPRLNQHFKYSSITTTIALAMKITENSPCWYCLEWKLWHNHFSWQFHCCEYSRRRWPIKFTRGATKCYQFNQYNIYWWCKGQPG